MNDYCKGSISIFFAIIIFVLIAFLLTIYDRTRLTMIQLEATSDFHLAAEQTLSLYDPVLFQEYGILAMPSTTETEQLFNKSLNKNFYPTQAKNSDYFLDYILNSSPSEIPLYINQPDSYEYNIEYVPFLDASLEYPKQEILDYMSQREGLLLLDFLMPDLDVYSKMHKTSSVMKQKDDLIMSLDQLSDYRKELYRLLDGITVFDDGKWAHNVDLPYIRQFTFDQAVDYSYFPEDLRDGLDEDTVNFSKTFSFFKSDLEEIDQIVNRLFEQGPIKTIVHAGNKPNSQVTYEYIVKPIVGETMTALKAYQTYLSQYQSYCQYILSLTQVHKDALALIDQIETVTNDKIEEINLFQSKTLKDDGLIQTAANQADQELNQLKIEISTMNKSSEEVDNLYLIKEKLESNLNALINSEVYIRVLNNDMDNYLYRLVMGDLETHEYREPEREIIKEAFSGLITDKGQELSALKSSYLSKTFSSLKSILSAYDSRVFMDYSMMEEEIPPIDYQEKHTLMGGLDVVKTMMSGDLFTFEDKPAVNEGLLASHMLDMNKSEGYELTLSRDSILLSEYVISMFSDAAKSNLPTSKTLNNYMVNEHHLTYEAEYIIGGSLDEQANLNTTLTYLYALRTSLNSIHLAIDHDKRMAIMKLASTIAGWWTGGAGALIIAVIIGGLWSLMESVVDVFILTSGGSVPMIKTSSTWYTSLDGNIEELFNTGIQRLENEATIEVDELEKWVEEETGNIYDDIMTKKHSVSEETWKEIESNLKDYEDDLQVSAKDAKIQQEQVINGIEIQARQYFEQVVQGYIEEGSNYQLPEPNITEEYEVGINQTASEMAKDFLTRVGQLDEPAQLADIVEVKNAVIDDYDTTITERVKKYSDLMDLALEKLMEVNIDGAKMLVDKSLDEKVAIGKKALHDQADQLKQQFLDESVGSAKEDFELSINPSVDYEGYLLLVMELAGISDDLKVSRILDLIQMNLMKKYDNYQLNFADYHLGIKTSGLVREDPFFIPNIKDGAINNEWELKIEEFTTVYE